MSSYRFVTATLHGRWRLLTLSALPASVTLRLTRRGNTVTAQYAANDSKIFQDAGTVTFDPPLAQTVSVGPAITAGRAGYFPRRSLSTALFGVPKVTPP